LKKDQSTVSVESKSDSGSNASNIKNETGSGEQAVVMEGKEKKSLKEKIKAKLHKH
jgi:hypothetical protein